MKFVLQFYFRINLTYCYAKVAKNNILCKYLPTCYITIWNSKLTFRNAHKGRQLTNAQNLFYVCVHESFLRRNVSKTSLHGTWASLGRNGLSLSKCQVKKENLYARKS